MASDKKRYKNARINFSTVEEQSLKDYQHWSSLSPGKRIAEATRLIRQVYGLDEKRTQRPLRIIFDTE